MPRLTVALALALQLSSCFAPANALILCVSNDGCLELELAQLGTRRCVESECDDGHAVDASHSCRDIPILSDSIATTRTTVPASSGVAGSLPAETQAPDRRVGVAVLTLARAAAPPGLPPRRTIVLQL